MYYRCILYYTYYMYIHLMCIAIMAEKPFGFLQYTLCVISQLHSILLWDILLCRHNDVGPTSAPTDAVPILSQYWPNAVPILSRYWPNAVPILCRFLLTGSTILDHYRWPTLSLFLPLTSSHTSVHWEKCSRASIGSRVSSGQCWPDLGPTSAN